MNDTQRIAAYAISADRLIMLIIALLCVLAGFKMFVLGITGKMKISAKAKELGEVTITDVSPGAFLFLVGCVICCMVVTHPMTVTTEKSANGSKDVIAGALARVLPTYAVKPAENLLWYAIAMLLGGLLLFATYLFLENRKPNPHAYSSSWRYKGVEEVEGSVTEEVEEEGEFVESKEPVDPNKPMPSDYRIR